MADLQSAAGTFHSEAAAFQAIMPDACVPLPDGGSAAVNGSLNAVVEMITLAHMQIGAGIDDNGTKLQTAHDRYQHTEESLTRLAQQITGPAKIH